MNDAFRVSGVERFHQLAGDGSVSATGIFPLAILSAMVERSEQPRNIPFEEVAVKKLVLNQEVAKALGITFPPDIAQAASR